MPGRGQGRVGSDYFRGLTRATWHDSRDIVLDPVLRTVDAARFESPACNGLALFSQHGHLRHSPRSCAKGPTLAPLAQVIAVSVADRPRSLHRRVSGSASISTVKSSSARPFATWSPRGPIRGAACGSAATSPSTIRFEVTLFRPMPVWKMLVKTPKLYSGQLDNEPTIEKLSGSRIEIEADPPILAEVDGDVIVSGRLDDRPPRRIPLCFPRVYAEQAHAPEFIRLRLLFFCGAADRIKPPAHAFPGTTSAPTATWNATAQETGPGISGFSAA